jgi:hypothetical protein
VRGERAWRVHEGGVCKVDLCGSLVLLMVGGRWNMGGSRRSALLSATGSHRCVGRAGRGTGEFARWTHVVDWLC